ncbi:hypothetical protein HMI49_13840 [Corallococcus exercitus]|uniref:Uncharacterized protein n=1 Tax=Corallococcus exercitus TaxID=2316736 RepID=A0A7Y4KKB9_9BACT|nr:hypothetical protein [Corallococcus exercitus]NOK34279.1 hypothetical protein [Corallococcus exercitus]
MGALICDTCGMMNVPNSHFGSRECEAKRYIRKMEALGYAPFPCRRWTRAFRSAGLQVVHGPITLNREGNWAPKWILDSFKAARTMAYIRKLPFKEQVAWHMKVALLVERHHAASP